MTSIQVVFAVEGVFSLTIYPVIRFGDYGLTFDAVLPMIPAELMALMVIGLTLFFGIHMASAVGIRDRAVARLGLGTWMGLYSLVAMAGMGLMVYGFGQARLRPEWVWVPPAELRTASMVLMLPVAPLLWAAYFPGRIRQLAGGHPMVVAVVIWAIAHGLSNGFLHEMVFFGAWMGWALISFWSLRRRPERPLMVKVPHSPWNDVVALVGGLAVYAAFLGGLHAWLFGVSPSS